MARLLPLVSELISAVPRMPFDKIQEEDDTKKCYFPLKLSKGETGIHQTKLPLLPLSQQNSVLAHVKECLTITK